MEHVKSAAIGPLILAGFWDLKIYNQSGAQFSLVLQLFGGTLEYRQGGPPRRGQWL